MSTITADLKRLLRRLRPRPEASSFADLGPLRASLRAVQGTPEDRIAASLAQLGADDARALLASLSGALGPDGAPLGRPEDARDALWCAALARLRLIRDGQPVAPEAEGLLISGIDALYHLQGEQDALPGGSPEPSPPLSWTLYRALLAWGLDSGAPPAGDDPLALALAGPSPGAPAALSGPRWAMWAWRSTGLAVAHSLVAKRPGRVFADGREGRVSLDLAGLPVVTGESTVGDGDGAGGELETARVDGRKVRLVSRAPTWARDALVQGSRLVVRDEGMGRVAWQIGADWTLEETATGYLGRAAGLSLEIKPDPAWRWTLTGGALQGVRGAGPAEVQTSFEIRT